MLVASCVLGGFDRGELAGTGGGGSGAAGGAGGDVAGGGAGADANGRIVPECQSLTVPPPPVDAPPGGTIEAVMAMDSLDFGEGTAITEVGLDLDEKCTCQGDGTSCVPPTAKLPCDAPRGVDNAGHVLFKQLAAGGLLNSDALSARALDGQFSILLRVLDYNGEPDDAQVSVEWLIAKGLGAVAMWDGEDSWPISGASFVENMAPYNTPVSRDLDAYVTNGTLVASLAETTMRFGSFDEGMTIRVVGTILQGKLESGMFSNEERWYLSDVLLTSRWPAKEIFNSIASFRDPNSTTICTDDPVFLVARAAVCGQLDIFSGEGVVGPTTPCDALSFGIKYTSLPARVGSVSDPTPLTLTNCDDLTNPAGETCL